MDDTKMPALTEADAHAVAERLQPTFETMLKAHLQPLSADLVNTVKMLMETVSGLKDEVREKDEKLASLTRVFSQLQVGCEDIDSGREAIRALGEQDRLITTLGTYHEMCKERVFLNPPLLLDEITMTYRGAAHSAVTPEDGVQSMAPKLRSVKFVSRRRPSPDMPEDQEHEETTTRHCVGQDMAPSDQVLSPVGLDDELAETRTNEAYRKMIYHQPGQIQDTWVIFFFRLWGDMFIHMYQAASAPI